MIIGISGKAGSGKSTMADYLVKNKKFVSISLADPLKRFCREVYGFSEATLWGSSDMRSCPDGRYQRSDGTFLTAREALQRLGSEWGRTCYENTWVDLCMSHASRVLGGESYDPVRGFSHTLWELIFREKVVGVVIPDVRFDNEAERIKDGGGVIVRLSSPWSQASASGIQGHDSEAGINTGLVDHDLEVTKGLPNFYKQVDTLLEEISRP